MVATIDIRAEDENGNVTIFCPELLPLGSSEQFIDIAKCTKSDDTKNPLTKKRSDPRDLLANRDLLAKRVKNFIHAGEIENGTNNKADVHDHIKELTLMDVTLRDEDFLKIFRIPRFSDNYFKNLKKLNLQGNLLTPEAMNRLLILSRDGHLPSLTEINLSHNNLGSIGGELFVKMMKQQIFQKNEDINHPTTTATATTSQPNNIRLNNSPRYYSDSEGITSSTPNQFPKVTLRDIEIGIENNSSDVDSNRAHHSNFVPAETESDTNNKQSQQCFSSINLSHNNIGDEAANQLAELLKYNPDTKEVYLDGNNISRYQALEMAELIYGYNSTVVKMTLTEEKDPEINQILRESLVRNSKKAGVASTLYGNQTKGMFSIMAATTAYIGSDSLLTYRETRNDLKLLSNVAVAIGALSSIAFTDLGEQLRKGTETFYRKGNWSILNLEVNQKIIAECLPILAVIIAIAAPHIKNELNTESIDKKEKGDPALITTSTLLGLWAFYTIGTRILANYAKQEIPKLDDPSKDGQINIISDRYISSPQEAEINRLISETEEDFKNFLKEKTNSEQNDNSFLLNIDDFFDHNQSQEIKEEIFPLIENKDEPATGSVAEPKKTSLTPSLSRKDPSKQTPRHTFHLPSDSSEDSLTQSQSDLPSASEIIDASAIVLDSKSRSNSSNSQG